MQFLIAPGLFANELVLFYSLWALPSNHEIVMHSPLISRYFYPIPYL